MSSPAWARGLLRWLAPADRQDEVLGDLEEAHRRRIGRHGRIVGTLVTGLEALDMGVALLRDRRARRRSVTPSFAAVRTEATSEPRVPLPSWLDLKLGCRMLIRYPGLTVVAGLAMAFAITLGAGTFEFLNDFLYPRIPLHEGDRLVSVWHRDLRTGQDESVWPHDFVTWREELRSVSEIGAFNSFERNVLAEGGGARRLMGAEMTAGAFRMARVPPLLGRPLLETDERPGAADVVVIGHEVWRTLFERDPDVVGRTVRLGATAATVVGVMPEGFTYPRSHHLWTPLRLDPAGLQPGEGSSVGVVARLAPGATLEEARAELAALGRRASLRFPETHEHLRPDVLRYGKIPIPVAGVTQMAFYSMNIVFFALLMLLVCGNVALLLFARTAARESELVVRSALGASRRRIVTQLAAEALVLGVLGAALGIWGANAGLQWVLDVLRRQGADYLLGFWFDGGLSAGTVAYAFAFATVAAIGAGVVPALRVTGRGVQSRLQRARAGGSGLEFGRLWTSVIVTQVAATAAFVPIVIILGVQTAQVRDFDPGFPAEEYLSVQVEWNQARTVGLEFEGPGRAAEGGFASAYRELAGRLEEDPAVTAVTLARNVPGEYHGWARIELDAATVPPGASAVRRVESTSVDPDFFDDLGARIVAGRGFDPVDAESRERVAIVNEDFVRVVLEGRNPIGQRVAFVNLVDEAMPDSVLKTWYEIVGVVEQISMTMSPDRDHGAGVYTVLDAADPYPVRIIARVAGADPMTLAPRLRALAEDVDPGLLLEDMRPASEAAWQTELAYASWFWVVLGAGGIGLLLALAGIYSIMSFTVSRRTREIGVRVALGAGARRVVVEIFARAFRQIGLGILLGGLLFVAFVFAVSDNPSVSLLDVSFLAGCLALMTGVCLVACVVPARRALRIEPTEALKADG